MSDQRSGGLWSHPGFMKLWAASAISDGGSQVTMVGSEFTQWMAIVVYYVSAVSVRQALVPHRLRGRVNATMRFLAGGAMPIGALIGGALGEVIGLPWTLVAAELGMLLGFVWLRLSPVRGLRELPAGEGGGHGG